RAWDKRKQEYKMSGQIVRTQSVAQTAEGDKNGLWTTVIAAAVFMENDGK
ncbi:MAG: pyruvoyl-dependent arginine decarboxylase, partial [Euryarchaeota archaeon]|nr:pyruvoyl-dependent arginine decarboxylase [Euryarchaeota archaeon]